MRRRRMGDEEKKIADKPEEEKKPVKAPGLDEAHPELVERYQRMSEVFFDIREALGKGGPAPAELVEEAGELLDWADALKAEAMVDPDDFEKRADRGRESFSTALRLKGDDQTLAQLMASMDDLRSVL